MTSAQAIAEPAIVITPEAMEEYRKADRRATRIAAVIIIAWAIGMLLADAYFGSHDVNAITPMDFYVPG